MRRERIDRYSRPEFFREFTENVAEHVVTVIADDGVRRHLRCAKPGTYNQSFDIITWPGHLCYSGDMGTYVFARIEDMFRFFRCRKERTHESINAGYWAEKLLAADRHSGFEAFCEERFTDAIREAFRHREFESWSEMRRAWEAVTDDVLRSVDSEESAYRTASEFEWEGRQLFPDFWEYCLKAYTGRYVWCCFALQWAIERYDERKAAKAEPAEVAQ